MSNQQERGSEFAAQQERESARTWAIGMLSNHVAKKMYGSITFTLKEGKIIEMTENITRRPS